MRPATLRTVFAVRASQCAEKEAEQETLRSLYSEGSVGVNPDVSLQVFNFKLNGATHSASFMALQQPTGICQSYSWNSDATLSELISDSKSFQSDLDEARRTDGVYASVADQIAQAAFPSRRHGDGCGSAAAFQALIELARDKDVRMFARVSDENGRLLIVPLGLLAMSMDNGHRVFAHDIHIFQPVAREALSETDCVSAWTFVLPAELKGIVDPSVLVPPPPLNGDPRVLRNKTAFINQFIDLPDSENGPTGLLLLAHHQDGVLTFSGPGDSLVFTQFERELGEGSVAVLSACETVNLSSSTKLVDRLNDKGVDALIAASFEVDLHFGIHFAFDLAKVIEESAGQSITLEDAFTKAASQASGELTQSTSAERARGMGLEMVLVGNPRLKICVPLPVAH